MKHNKHTTSLRRQMQHKPVAPRPRERVSEKRATVITPPVSLWQQVVNRIPRTPVIAPPRRQRPVIAPKSNVQYSKPQEKAA